MPKKKGTSKGSGAATSPVCNCEHPYNCDCGNRPPRPSKGHKWDPVAKAWGGKGHKQKGAALGQAATVAKDKVITTTVGQTTLRPHERLPSKILADFCQNQKRPRPFYKEMQKGGNSSFQVRLIVKETSATKDDLHFVPAAAVSNAEQAREEAALLALLHFTPTLPHERILPEPYRTTWLHAIQANKQQQQSAKTNSSGANNDNNNKAVASKKTTPTSVSNNSTDATLASSSAASSAAQASTSLRSAVSVNAKTRQAERQRLQAARNARIQKHEAIRLANQPHPVFMSAKLRQAIQHLLRHETDQVDVDDIDNDNEDEQEGAIYQNSMQNAVQAYVEDRLHKEGFTRKQARQAFEQVFSSSSSLPSTSDDDWDQVHEQALQWLLVHVDEEDLPASFDPRGRTLDVIAASTNSSSRNSKTKAVTLDPALIQFAQTHGLSPVDAARIVEDNQQDPQRALWETACRLAQVTTPQVAGNVDKAMIDDEVEALEAIFAEECHISRSDNGITTIQLPLDGMLTMHATIHTDEYPQTWPQCVAVKGDKAWTQGLSLLVDMAKFLSSDVVLGEPMLFAIHGHIMELVQAIDELPALSLHPQGTAKKQSTRKDNPSAINITATPNSTVSSKAPSSRPPSQKRPREKSPFWSIPALQTPPAIPFPVTALKHARSILPAAKARSDFLDALRRADKGSHVVLCTGETGCGKSTQLPQFILEEYPKEAKIVVCQPRRLAATGVANRVAEERGESRPGEESVGYVVRGDSAMCKKSRLVFCTTGVLLRQLQNQSALSCLTHIVIDEVHERSLDSDILLALLKQSLPSNPHLRVVLMSATLDADRFLSYWDGETPRIHIPGRTFPVQDFTLEDVLALTQYIPPKRKKGKGASRNDAWDEDGDEEEDEGDGAEEELIGGHSVGDLVKRVDETSIDYDLVAQLVRYIITNRDPSDDGSILIFLPGAPEIDRALDIVKKVTRELPVQLLPLHGGLHPAEQNRVFRPAGSGLYKIVLSTNVAETSVTIPDCTVVIDSAREKQSSYDPSNRMPLLLEQFCSKASLKQRRGRAGRVREGTCYKLISKATFSKLRDHSEPEIRRSALDQTLLSILFLGMEVRPQGGFMNSLLDPPDRASIEAAAVSLQSLGAIDINDTGAYSLTPLGVHLAGIPAPPVVGKILIVGSILGCRNAALAMAAGMSVGRSPFLRIGTRRKPRRKGAADEPDSIEETKKKMVLEERRNLFQTVGNSDHALLAAVYLMWESIAKGPPRRQYCDSMGLSFQGMRDVAQLVNQLDSALSGIGYRVTADSNRNGKSWRIIRAVAVAGMAPGQLVKVVRPAAAYLETAEGAKEKDGEARQLKFFVRTDAAQVLEDSRSKEERVFIHPSSANFSTGTYSCPWLVFFSLVRTSKPFLRDVTECNSYSLLLFGGQLEVQASKDIVVVDGWCQLGAHARIGSLVGGLRKRLDELLTEKITNPSLDIAASKEMSVIYKLITTDGLGA